MEGILEGLGSGDAIFEKVRGGFEKFDGGRVMFGGEVSCV